MVCGYGGLAPIGCGVKRGPATALQQQVSMAAHENPLPMQQVLVTAPANAQPGQQIEIALGGTRAQVAVPAGVSPGMQFMVAVPQQPAAQASQVSVTVPPGALPGQSIQIALPDGTQARVEVPQGLSPGMQFIAMLRRVS